MDDELMGYFEYLSNFSGLTRPKMPKFNLDAYSDSEYIDAVNSVMKDYENVDDFDLTITHLKGK